MNIPTFLSPNNFFLLVHSFLLTHFFLPQTCCDFCSSYRCIPLALIVTSFLLTIIIFLLSFLFFFFFFLPWPLLNPPWDCYMCCLFSFFKILWGRYFANIQNNKTPCMLNVGKCMNLKEMALSWIKQNEVNYEHIPEEPVGNVEKRQISPNYIHPKWDYEFFFFLLLTSANCSEVKNRKTCHLVIMLYSQLKFDELFS